MPRTQTVDNGRKHFPLPSGELKILMAVLEAHQLDEDGLVIPVIADWIKRDLRCTYTLIYRLRDRGLIKTKMVIRISKKEKPHRFSRVSLTPLGSKLAKRWDAFVRSIGPELCKLIGWKNA